MYTDVASGGEIGGSTSVGCVCGAADVLRGAEMTWRRARMVGDSGVGTEEQRGQRGRRGGERGWSTRARMVGEDSGVSAEEQR